MESEIWKDIKDYEGYYQVSNFGRVRSLDVFVPTKNKSFRFKKGKILKQCMNSNYLDVCLSKKTHKRITVHRLVAETFLPNPENKPQVNHKDGNKQNNNVDNLEWVTHSENTQHAYSNGLTQGPKGEQNGGAKLTKSQVIYIRNHYIPRDKQYGMIALSKLFSVSETTIYRIIHNILWKDVIKEVV